VSARVTVVCVILLFLSFARVLHVFARERDPTWDATTREAGEESVTGSAATRVDLRP
jgi:hypothetical protein